MWLALAPEGTRRFDDGLRSGFYHVAVQAQVPLGLAGLDFARREVALVDFLQLCGDPRPTWPRSRRGWGIIVAAGPSGPRRFA